MSDDFARPPQRGERVCDRCTIKKTKCNRQKPSCSRCMDNGEKCTYSSRKRKPGPPKGYRVHARQSSAGTHGTATSVSAKEIDIFDQLSLNPFDPEDHSISTPLVREPRDTASQLEQIENFERVTQACEATFSKLDHDNERKLSYEAEYDLLNVFLDNVQPHYPLFRRPELLQRYAEGCLPRRLICAIVAVSVVFSSDPAVALDLSKVSENYASVVREKCTQILVSDVSASIDDLRMLFLLGLYEFRSVPNRKAWTTVGHLVRLCYYYGLHQVDNPGNCAFFDKDLTTLEELESWRYLWWSTYILDCCCNTILGTPPNIDLDSLCTALPSGTIKAWTDGKEFHPITRFFINKDIEEMSEMVRRLTSSWLNKPIEEQEVDVTFVVRIFNTLNLVAISNLRRIMLANPSKQVDKRWQATSDMFTVFQLSLPARYHNPQRCVSFGETKEAHAIRLGILLEFGACNMILWIPRAATLTDDDTWHTRWEASMEAVDRIVSVLKQWDSLMWYLADPCIAYIVFIASCMLHLHSNLQENLTRPGDRRQINRASWTLCKVFLQQLGEHWILPKALSAATERFRDAVSSPVSLENASELLNNLQKPLVFRDILERKLTITDGRYYLPSISFSEDFEAQSFQDWLSFFEQDKESFMQYTI